MLADLAMRDGQRVLAFDLFGDLDLRRRARRVVTPAEVGRGGLAALAMASRRPTAGSERTSCSTRSPSPPAAARRMAS